MSTVTDGPGPGAAVRLVAAALDAGVATGAVLAVGRGARVHGVHVFGRTGSGEAGAPVTADTLFDVASLTKVVATTPAVLRLHDAAALDLTDPVSRYLPAYAEGAKAGVRLWHLLTHTSGLPAHRAFHELPGTPAERLAAAGREPLAAAPGSRVEYSDIGFILLGAIVAKAAGQGLDAAVRELVTGPLGLAHTGYRPITDEGGGPRDGSDESGGNYRRDGTEGDASMIFAATEPDPVTGVPKAGRVHDENADALGGVAGHAGLFSTVGDLIGFLTRGWLTEDAGFLSPATRTAATRCWTRDLDGRRGLGWTLAGDRWDHMTAAWPHTRAGHTGFTGTSLAFDPAGGLWTVLLTNAVHFGRDHAGIALLRRTVHAAVAAWADTAGYDRAVRFQGDR